MGALTDRQEEFLLLFATLNGRKRCLSDAAAHFGVSKPTVSSIVSTLVERGMITKKAYGTILLTAKGEKYVSAKMLQYTALSQWLQNDCGLTPVQAERDARMMVSTLPCESIDGIVKSLSKNAKTSKPEKKLIDTIKCKQIPFVIYKPDGASISMGDKGFDKPATLRQQNENLWVVLAPKHLQYRPGQHRAILKGKLERLWYYHDGRWHESAHQEDGCHYIPLIYFEDNEKTLKKTLRIRARASVGVFTMPESEAILTLDFSGE